MLTGVALLPTHDVVFPGDWAFVYGVIALIALIFIRMYVWGDRSRRRAVHRSGRRAVQRTGHVPGRGGSRGRRTVSRRRPDRP